ncbi:MAG: F0F1 ATP synthase subunit B [Flavobacteriales bacterium]|nr:F0F1 ATP synthase subunit B [Flavobacteriales bacterium]MCB0794626.1 F0F1 ATP synthase subunit B [Flavobacteriales bacterium]
MLLASLVEPSFGLIFWMTLSFLAVLFILRKFAWKPILDGLKDRENSIADALNEAKKAREEIATMKAGNEALMREAREEREVLLKEARDIRDREIAGAKEKAKAEAEAILERAREEIRNEKNAALAELKLQVGELSVEIAEKILLEKLGNDAAQRALVDRMLKDAESRLS